MYAHPQQNASYDVADLRKQAGRWLKALREQAGLSQRQLASAVGVEFYTFIAQLEAGRGRIPPDRYEDFAKALGTDVRPFVKKLMSFYDPVTYRHLFGEPAAND